MRKLRSVTKSTRRRAAVVAVGLVLTAGTAQAGRAAEEFGGYRASATGEVISFHPRLPGFTVVEEPFEGTIGLSHAVAATGGGTFARSSVVWPGDLPANFGSLLSAAGAPVKIPNYPVRAEAREFDGERSATLPGITMKANGTPKAATAESNIAALDLPGVARIGSASSFSQSRAEADIVVGETTVELGDVSLLNGLITIDSIVSTSKATSDAASGASSGTVTVVGLNVAGTPAVVDSNGVRARDQRVATPVDLNKQIAAALSQVGARLVVTGGEGGVNGPDGSRLSSGLLLTFKTVGFSSIPPCECSVLLGSTKASATATKAADEFLDTLFEPPPDVPADGGGAELSDLSLSPGLETLDALTSATGVNGSVGSAPTAVAPRTRGVGTTGNLASAPGATPAYRYGGIPVGAVALTGVALVIGARRVRRYVDRLMAAGIQS